jgi:hypothetical protein
MQSVPAAADGWFVLYLVEKDAKPVASGDLSQERGEAWVGYYFMECGTQPVEVVDFEKLASTSVIAVFVFDTRMRFGAAFENLVEILSRSRDESAVQQRAAEDEAVTFVVPLALLRRSRSRRRVRTAKTPEQP